MRCKAPLSSELFFCRTSDFLNSFLVKQCNRSDKTRTAYRDALTVFKRFVEHCGKSILTFLYTDCTYEFMLDYKEYLAFVLHYAPSSVNQRMAAIKAYVKYSYGCDASLMQVYIRISSVPASKTPKKVGEVLDDEKVASLLDKPPATRKGLRDTVILSILFDAAIRLDELVCLTAGDIYEHDGYTFLLVHGKGNKERKVALDEQTSRILSLYMKEYHPDADSSDKPLIYTVINGETKRMSHRNVQKILKKYGSETGKEFDDMPKSCHPHLLRRSRATNLYQNGTPIEIVSRFLGHSTVETTKDHYAVLSLEQMREAMEAGNEKIPDRESALWVGHEDELSRLCGLR